MGNPTNISGKDEGPQKLASQKNKGTYKQLLLSKDKEQCQLSAECAAGDTGGYSEDSRMAGLNGGRKRQMLEQQLCGSVSTAFLI